MTAVLDSPYFEQYDLPLLISSYNSMAKEMREQFGFGRQDRKAFKNKQDAVVNCQALWREISLARQNAAPSKHPKGRTTMTDVETSTDEVPTKKTKAAKAVGAKAAKPAKAAKAEKPAKAAKAAAKEVNEGGRKGRAALYADNAKIKTASKTNPSKREDSVAYQMYEKARESKTFGEYREAGGNLKYLYWLQERGHLTIG